MLTGTGFAPSAWQHYATVFPYTFLWLSALALCLCDGVSVKTGSGVLPENLSVGRFLQGEVWRASTAHTDHHLDSSQFLYDKAANPSP